MTLPKPATSWQNGLPSQLPLHFRRNVEEGPDGCWLWTRSTSQDGYGWASLNSRTYQAHRLAYILVIGEPPTGLVLDHLCRVRHCVRPDHLEPVTPLENLLRSPLTTAGMTHCSDGHPLQPWHGQRRCVTCHDARKDSYGKLGLVA
jgi:hypothetical protein